MRLSQSIVVAILVAGCQANDSLEVSETRQALQGGTVTQGHPEIGLFGLNSVSGTGESCTSTLIAPRWVLTAAHCVHFSTTVPSKKIVNGKETGCEYVYDSTYRGQGTPSTVFKIEKVFNFGGTNPQTNPCAMDTTYQTLGRNDIALVLLTKPNTAAQPASFATDTPSSGETICGFGMGNYDQKGNYDYNMRYLDHTLTADDSIVKGRDEETYFTSPGYYRKGDSGGPHMLGSYQSGPSQIFGVSSRATADMLELGLIVPNRNRICSAMYNEEPHTWCVPGQPLIVPIRGCESEQSQQNRDLHTHEVVMQVCKDHPDCCDPAKSWDVSCVRWGADHAKSQSWGDLCGRDAWSQGPINGTDQYYPRDFNLFTVEGNAEDFTDSFGPIAASGSVVAQNFNLNWATSLAVGILAGGEVRLQNGTVTGDIYGTKDGGIANVTQRLGGVTKPALAKISSIPAINFSDARAKLQAMSKSLAAYTATPNPERASVTITPNGCIDLYNSDPVLNVFSLTSKQLSGAASCGITFHVPLSSFALVNVTGGATADDFPSFRNMSIDISAGPSGTRLLWNFPDATMLTMASVDLRGSILAPYADLFFEGGGAMAIGNLVAKSAKNAWFELRGGTLNWPPF